VQLDGSELASPLLDVPLEVNVSWGDTWAAAKG